MSRDASTPVALLAGSLLLALVCYGVLLHQDRDLEFVRSRIPGQFQTPLLNIRLKSRADRAERLENSIHPTVLFIHGLSASKSVMVHLGTQFAKWGMNSYLIDLPGHGESNGKFSWANCQSAVQEALGYLRTVSARGPAVYVYGPADPSVFLVGHSMGGALAIQAGRLEADVAGVIAVSPAATQVDRTAPRNLLILVGEFDLPFVRRGAIFLFQQATGMSAVELEDFQARSSPDGSKRVVVLPWTEHSLGIFTPRSLFEMAAWLQRSYPEMHFDTQSSLTELFLRLSVCSLLLYSLVPGFDLLHRGISLLNTKRRSAAEDETAVREPDSTLPPIQGSGWRNGLPPLWLYGLAGILSVVILLTFNPWNRLQLMGGGYLCGFLCLTGLLALCWQRPPRTIWSCSWVDLAAVLLSVVFFVCLAGPLFSRLLVHLTVSQTRFWRLPITTVSIYPFFLFFEWVSRRRITASNLGKLVCFHFSTRLLLALILILGFFLLQNSQFLIVLILPALLILTSVCWLQTWGVYSKTRSAAASAAFGALLAAWFLSIFFVQL